MARKDPRGAAPAAGNRPVRQTVQPSASSSACEKGHDKAEHSAKNEAVKKPKVDRAVLDFVKGHVLDPADFVIRADGLCRLNPEMARMVVARVST